MFTYAATHFIGGNGFLAIYLSAVVLGNSSFIHRRTLIRFYEGQAWLMQIVLFLTLGLLVFPSRIVAVAGMGLLISAFLIFVARPIGVFTSLAFFRTNTRSKLFISWVGLRGGVPIVFATYPLLAGIEKAPLLFNLVFFISVTSVLFQGTTLAYVAKLLGVAAPTPQSPRPGGNTLEQHRSGSTELKVTPGSSIIGQRIVNLKLPASISITYIKRGETFIQPVGSTIILEGDVLYILADNEQAIEKAHQLTLQV
jgi:cell volume regulation protein A